MEKMTTQDLAEELKKKSHVLDFIAESFLLKTEKYDSFSDEALLGAGLILLDYKDIVNELYNSYFENIRRSS